MLFRRKKAEREEKPTRTQPAETAKTCKYPKPKILLVDMPPKCAQVLSQAGYNVSVGTFGIPRAVDKCDNLFPMPSASADLPDYEEQEIVIANLARPEPADTPLEGLPGRGVGIVCQEGTEGVIDQRPLVMTRVCPAFDRIREYGGIFIFFASEPYEVEYAIGQVGPYDTPHVEKRITFSNHCCLTELESVAMEPQRGSEITFESSSDEFRDLLRKGAKDARYHCTLRVKPWGESEWIPLAENKYGQDVGGLLAYPQPQGHVLLLPQMPQVHRILVELVGKWCSSWKPFLFPYADATQWIQRPEYDLPKVQELHRQIESIERAAADQVQNLKDKIEEERAAHRHWQTLLTGTGHDLKQAVILALQNLGFEKVTDVDKDAEQRGEGRALREDIRIHDRAPVLIVDVKGLQGHPSDDDARQAEKHATLRRAEWSNVEVRGLTIINHQRQQPPRNRDAKAFRDEIVKYAEEAGLGLMTTWDLFRLLSNASRLGWSPEVVRPIFYRAGKIEPIPDHYDEVGRIEKLWQPAFTVNPSQPLRVGERLAVETEDTFEELTIPSLQIDGQPVQEAPADTRCGIGCEGASERFHEGARVFIVRMQSGQS
ncbi:MAG: hypothetical protein KAW17_12030 [Candidatus Eisenbacteria sp.]|nr:hypothetical protein [Candidatus Eisenbacteria bacterium]